jgi:hypothetical protein
LGLEEEEPQINADERGLDEQAGIGRPVTCGPGSVGGVGGVQPRAGCLVGEGDGDVAPAGQEARATSDRLLILFGLGESGSVWFFATGLIDFAAGGG